MVCRISTLMIIVLGICYQALGQDMSSEGFVPIPSQAQLNWQNAELAVVFHYDLHVFDGKKYNQAVNRITPIEDYNIFNPVLLDTDQWVKAAKDMGAKIAIITATHETGFAIYQSDVNPYSLKVVNWRDGKGDIVADFVKSCKKFDIQPAIYVGIRWNSFYGIHDFKVNGDNDFAKARQEQYNRMCEGMVDELTSKYGDLAMIWFDGGAHGPKQGGPDVLSIVSKNQPNTLFYHNLDRADMRWGGSESGTVPYPCWGTYPTASWFENRGDEINYRPIKYGDPDGRFYCPAMSDAPLRGYNGRHEWFWEPGDEEHIFPLENLMNMYYKSVGHNSTLIIGLTPNSDGLMPEPDVERLQEWGREIKSRFSNPLVRTSGSGNEIIAKFESAKKINHIVVEENIVKGERVKEFILEAKTKDTWVQIGEGTCIGHKFIIKFEEMTVSEVRLSITKSKGQADIANLAIYHVEE